MFGMKRSGLLCGVVRKFSGLNVGSVGRCEAELVFSQHTLVPVCMETPQPEVGISRHCSPTPTAWHFFSPWTGVFIWEEMPC